MHAVLSGLRLSTASFPASLTSKPILPDKEFADGSLYFPSRRDALQLSVSSIRSEGTKGRRSRKSSGSRRPTKEGSTLDPIASDSKESKSSSQEEIIALFKRIQSSISKESNVGKKRNSRRKKQRKSTESVLEELRQYPQPQKQSKDKISLLDNALPAEKDKPDKEERISPPENAFPAEKDKQDEGERNADASPVGRLPRPASNFKKRSPTRSIASTKEDTADEEPVVETRDVAREESPAAASETLELREIDSLKLPELKELAKSKGVRGFSKMKKGELAELLKGMAEHS